MSKDDIYKFFFKKSKKRPLQSNLTKPTNRTQKTYRKKHAMSMGIIVKTGMVSGTRPE